ncbi:MAG: hypothetical protein HOD26_22745, partial [Gammaproteobacteria bacterium]|nr:hypothetical protein [Gammaproteobacteria bacterium]
KQGKAVTLVNRIDWNKNSSIERYLKIRFELRWVKGLKADYTGPGKLKKSGKAVGARKKPGKLSASKSPAPKKRARNKKNIGKGRKAKGGETNSDETNAYEAKGSSLYSKYRKKTPE